MTPRPRKRGFFTGIPKPKTGLKHLTKVSYCGILEAIELRSVSSKATTYICGATFFKNSNRTHTVRTNHLTVRCKQAAAGIPGDAVIGSQYVTFPCQNALGKAPAVHGVFANPDYQSTYGKQRKSTSKRVAVYLTVPEASSVMTYASQDRNPCGGICRSHQHYRTNRGDAPEKISTWTVWATVQSSMQSAS